IAGPALARLLARSSVDAGELANGRAVLVVRAAEPRPAFAWRPWMDRAIGRVGWLRAPAKDGLSWEIEVPDVGRFHVGEASVAALPELGRRQPSGSFNALDGSVGPTRAGDSKDDLRRMGRGRIEDEPGVLGPDVLTAAQRFLLESIPEHEGASLEEVARAAGFTPENNRTPES